MTANGHGFIFEGKAVIRFCSLIAVANIVEVLNATKLYPSK